MLTKLQQQAWDSVSPASVLRELQKNYTIEAAADTIKVTPRPNDKLCYQIKRFKPKLLELLGVGKTTRDRIDDAWRSMGVDPDSYQAQERQAIATEQDYQGAASFPTPQETPPVEPPWPTPVIERIKQGYCQHRQTQQYRRKLEGAVVVQVLCPECGRNMRGPRRFSQAKKRTSIPWWPAESPVVPDPDAETDELVEWWSSVEHTITDGMMFSHGVVISDAMAFRKTMDELIALWKFGDPDFGLKAQLSAHRNYLRSMEAA